MRHTGLLIFSTLFFSCIYQSDLPLANDCPEYTDHTCINHTLYYPDSTVCTLSIRDLNDKSLFLSALPCTSSDCESIADTLSLPCRFHQIEKTYDTKEIVLSFNSNQLGLYSGTLICRDLHNSTDLIPIQINNQFKDPFNSPSSLEENWRKYRNRDTNTVKFDYFTEPKLQIYFDTSTQNSVLSAGIVSSFSLSGDFKINIDYKLRDEMSDGFELGFFVSTSPDTGRWSGLNAGLFLYGNSGSIRLECKSINLQSYSSEVNLFSGELGLSRTGSQLEYFYHDGNPLAAPASLINHDFLPGDSVFVHIKMSVSDRNKYRHCLWNDFYALKGEINF